MSLKLNIEPQNEYLTVSVAGEYVPYEALEGFAEILIACNNNRLYKVLIDFRDVKGSITMEDRDEFIQSIIKQHSQFRKIYNRTLQIAFVGLASMIMKGYAEKMTSKTSLSIKSTTDIREAFVWLDIEQ